jgi:hypothetical protein
MRHALVLLIAFACVAVQRAAEPGVFSSYSVIELTLRAPLSDLFAKDDDNDASVTGTLSFRDASGRQVTLDNVAISERGNTSKQANECRFPKLKLRLDKSEARDASMFRNMDTIKLGTHCGESPDGTLTKKYGRLANQHAAHREAFVYRLLDTLGVPSLRARPARITYQDTSTGAAADAITRDAMILEDDHDALKRLSGAKLIEMEQFRSAKEEIAPADAVNLAFAEALIGNFDWCLKFTPNDRYRCDARKPLWNLLAVARDDGTVVPVMYDFDISGMVTGRHPWFPAIFNAAFAERRSEPEVEVDAQLQRTRSLFSRADLDAARRRFAAKKAAAYRALADAAVDERGKQQIVRYLDPFFAAMERDEAFYLPVVVRENTRAFTDAAATQPACTVGGSLPVGTPVSAKPLARQDSRLQVIVLDALWHFTDRAKCSTILKSPVWVDGNAISSDYPRPASPPSIKQ